MRKKETIHFEQKETKNRNILEIEGKCMGMEMKIILVYIDVDKEKEGYIRNQKIRMEIEEKVEKK